MNFSYWEKETWFRDIDYAIIGSGIVGLSCALHLRKRFPHNKIVVFERGLLPNGASTKNAGFACFGSISEILEDLKTLSENEVVQLIKKRIEGLQLLRNNLGDENIDFQMNGGYEIFNENDDELFSECASKIDYVNELLNEVFSNKNEVFSVKKDPFSFKNVKKQVVFNCFEGQLHTGKMMKTLLQKCIEKNICILNCTKIDSFSSKNGKISLKLNDLEEISTKTLLIATNGFAKQLIDENVKPARAQVLITKPIPNLHIKGTFHLDRGFYYFRNIDNRILLGGGRNLDFKTEETTEMQLTKLVQNKLEELLHTTILPNTPFEIDARWSGIMGVGDTRMPIVKKLEPNVYCGVRLGGMGVAIGSLVGKELAQLPDNA